MNRSIRALIFFAMLATLGGLVPSAEAQIVVTGARGAAACPPVRVAPDRGANIRAPRRERNPYFVARPVYPPTPLGARASINFAPFTSKYYPDEIDSYPPLRTLSSTRSR
jgi:hypothetical protein